MIPFSLHSVQKDGIHASEKIDHVRVVMCTVSVSRGRLIFFDICVLFGSHWAETYVVTVASFLKVVLVYFPVLFSI